MRPPRMSLRSLMVVTALAAVWLYIAVQSRAYLRRHPTGSVFVAPPPDPDPAPAPASSPP